jgi:hypothetical protein
MSLAPLQLHTRVILNPDETPVLRWRRVVAYMLHMHYGWFHRDQKAERLTPRGTKK